MTLLVLLAIAGVGGLAWRKRSADSREASPAPAGQPVLGGLRTAPRPRLSDLAQTAAQAERDRLAAEAVARKLVSAREVTTSQQEYTILTEKIGEAREKVANAAAVKAAANATAAEIRAEEKAKSEELQARIMELAPQRERLVVAIREQRTLSSDARAAYLLLRTQRAAAVVANPWYKDLLGYEVTGAQSESERPYTTTRDLVDADSERGRFIQNSMGSRVILQDSVTRRVTEGVGSTVFANVLLVTSGMRATADAIDDATRRMADALRIEAESNAKAADMQAQLDAINGAMTGHTNGTKALGAAPKPSGRVLPLVPFSFGASSANGGGKS